MLDLARVFAETGQRAMVVPRPHPDARDPTGLVMERLDGFASTMSSRCSAPELDTRRCCARA